MTLPIIPNAAARRLFLSSQGLCRAPNRKLDAAGLLELIESIGFVQLDSIQTVERAHHMILFARNQTYRHKLLTRLHEREAALFENWTHDASIIPSRFYPYWQKRFARERRRLRESWQKTRRGDHREILQAVLERVRDEGPLMARDFEDESGRKKAGDGWWDWHPAKTALEYHWRTGTLAVARREGFQKVYDLSERVIPARHREDAPSAAEALDWACRGALQRLGFASSGEIAGFWGLVTAAEAAAWCAERLGKGELLEVRVEQQAGTKPRATYTTPALLERLDEPPEPPGRLRTLSPFDPVLRDRARCERLFGFDYRIEVFVPEAKRRYGYYVFPLLEGDRFVGRIDMKHERASGRLAVKGLWLEPKVRWSKGRAAALESELERVRRFTGAERIVYADGYRR